uniref:J domain-containing protein n=1 Tax=Chromera velia CCMP2878 TaxID=1169474 RepID=A0A0G4HE59_9ALVE|eukprot:Cvel_6455.t1-p1 / transcript=Cvel_6455.t1 / gene=Cvel_6455 / organism=Chromera_velia_CCMP2878 / gene_product=Chaperone protein DnaJ, putative / transcript_product=Chaperone protein DnaJ, putative / location=Cvel_scaffold316:17644-19011(+) / protein_length=456 / sequence_SO=supercontig / SO=protein_coding / is_pseudo=false
MFRLLGALPLSLSLLNSLSTEGFQFSPLSRGERRLFRLVHSPLQQPSRRPSPAVLSAEDGESSLSTVIDPYRVLGLEKGATDLEIKAKYKELYRQFHPDFGGDKLVMGEINDAYEILSDPRKKAQFDRTGTVEAEEEGEEVEEGEDDEGMIDPLGGFSGGGAVSPFGGMDLMEQLFGFGGMGGMGGRRQTRGEDLRVDIEVDFETAVFGGKQMVNVPRSEECGECEGRGTEKGTKPSECSACKGRGMITKQSRTAFGMSSISTTCRTCGGRGVMPGRPCNSCDGAGLVPASRTIEVDLPCGVEDGVRLRVEGEGNSGRNGGPSGDLYVFLKVKPHPQFSRAGQVISSEVPISVTDAILGKSITVPVVDGEVEISVPPGAQAGQTIKIPRRGAPKLGVEKSRGDHYVKLKVDIPKASSLTREERELVDKLDELLSQRLGSKPKKKKGKGGFFGFGKE